MPPVDNDDGDADEEPSSLSIRDISRKYSKSPFILLLVASIVASLVYFASDYESLATLRGDIDNKNDDLLLHDEGASNTTTTTFRNNSKKNMSIEELHALRFPGAKNNKTKMSESQNSNDDSDDSEIKIEELQTKARNETNATNGASSNSPNNNGTVATTKIEQATSETDDDHNKNEPIDSGGTLAKPNNSDDITQEDAAKRSKSIDSDGNYYIQLHIQGGWGNQLQCITNAYYFTRAVNTNNWHHRHQNQQSKMRNRTLVLPPLAPHILFKLKDVFDAKAKSFRLGANLTNQYLKRLSSKRYVPLERVLDLEATFPNVSTIDFRDYYNTDPKDDDIWVIESQYSHLNTIWTMDESSNLTGTYKSISRRENNQDMEYKQYYRHIGELTKQDHGDQSTTGPSSKSIMWTLLDSFRTAYDSSFTHDPVFQPRYSTLIRNMTVMVQKKAFGTAAGDDEYSTAATIPYAAIHVRGSDGPFKKKVDATITTVFKDIVPQYHEWLDSQITAVEQQEATASSTANKFSVGLFVATDLSNFCQNKVFRAKVSELKKSWQERYQPQNVTVTLDAVRYSPDYDNFIEQRLPDRGYLGDEPTIFVDQQIAACAEIGFSGTPGSSFSNSIKLLRKDRVDACL